MPAQESSAYPFPSQRVVVLRHGERRDSHPDAPAESNPPLTPGGVAAIQFTAARLKHYLGEEDARTAILIVSPFLRTVQTAESLQHHGVGAEHAMVVDNTLCEVFGPSRIKTSRAPQLQAAPATSRAVGGLPAWGETLETATQRYVANFLRNGDAYGGVLSATGSSDVSLSLRQESQNSSSFACPAAVTNRAMSANAATTSSGASLPAGSMDSAMISSLKSGQPHVVILVTHGDAISAVLSHFYPARVVYEADFLSFIIMRRYGAGNHVYHLDESVGVNWFVEGIDSEPQDPVLRMLENEREAALSRAAQQSRSLRRGNATNGAVVAAASDGYAEEDDVHDDDLEGEDDEGEALDDDCGDDVDDDGGDGPAHPASFAGSRMKPRVSRLPPRRIHSQRPANSVDVSLSSRQESAPPTQMHAPVHVNPPPPASGGAHRRGGGGSNGGGPLGGVGGSAGVTPTRSSHATSGSHSKRHHPKAGEDCERIRMPDGTPAQSSSGPVLSTMDDSARPRGHRSATDGSAGSSVSSSSSSSGGSGRRGVVSAAASSGAADMPSDATPPSNPCGDEQRVHGAGDGGLSRTVDRVPAKEAGVPINGVGSYSGLSEDPSSASWVRTNTTTAEFFSATSVRVAVRQQSETQVCDESASAGKGVVTAGGSLSPAAEPAAGSLGSSAPASAAAAAVAAAVVKSRRSSRPSSGVASPSLPPVQGVARSQYGATPAAAAGASALGGSFDEYTSTGPSAMADNGSVDYAVAMPNLARRVDCKKALFWGVVVSGVARVVCILLSVLGANLLPSREPLMWFFSLSVVWETVMSVVLTLSLRTHATHSLQLRRGIEQLRCGQLCTPFASASVTTDGVAAPGRASSATVVVHDDESSVTPFNRSRHGGAASGTHYESSMVWAESQPTGQDEEDAPRGALNRFLGERAAAEAGVLTARHVGATAAKLFVLCVLSFFGALLSDGHASDAVRSLLLLYSTPVGLLITLAYVGVNVLRGVWDETRLDSIMDQWRQACRAR